MPVSKSPETELSPLLTPKQVPDIRQKRTSTEDQGVEPAVADQAKSRLEGYNRRRSPPCRGAPRNGSRPRA